MSEGDAPGSAFTDGKAHGAMRTIGEVTRAYGIKSHVLRYWEQQFPMLSPLKRSGGRRYYRPEDVALVERIDRLINREGYTLKGARQVLEASAAPRAVAPPRALATPPAPVRDPAPVRSNRAELLPKLRDVRARLAQALEA
jgi:DNA-binding transcriptional MerR regulator